MIQKEVKVIEIKEEGAFCRRVCGTCGHLDMSKSDGYGRYYCPYMDEGAFRAYVSTDEDACRHYV